MMPWWFDYPWTDSFIRFMRAHVHASVVRTSTCIVYEADIA